MNPDALAHLDRTRASRAALLKQEREVRLLRAAAERAEKRAASAQRRAEDAAREAGARAMARATIADRRQQAHAARVAGLVEEIAAALVRCRYLAAPEAVRYDMSLHGVNPSGPTLRRAIEVMIRDGALLVLGAPPRWALMTGRGSWEAVSTHPECPLALEAVIGARE